MHKRIRNMDSTAERAKPRNQSKKWSKGQENGLVKLLKEGKQDLHIANLFGRSIDSIYFKKMLIAKKLFQEGADINEIAVNFRLSRSIIEDSPKSRNGSSQLQESDTKPENHGHRWDKAAEDSLLAKILNGSTDTEIGSKLGRTMGSIQSKKTQMARLLFKNGRDLVMLCELFNLHHDDINPLPCSDSDLLKICIAISEGQGNLEIQTQFDRCEVRIKSIRFKYKRIIEMLNRSLPIDDIVLQIKMSKVVVKRIQELTEDDDLPLSQIPPSQSQTTVLPELNFTEGPKFIAIHFKMQGRTFEEHITKGRIFDFKEEAIVYKAQHPDEMIAIVQSSDH